MKIQENDIVLCTVKRIEKTTVFLDIETPENLEGTMIFSEVAAGRIRNIRDFLTVNKKVVCKVLRIKNKNIELSLRRVTAKERDEVLENYKKEKSLEKILKSVLKEKTSEVLNKINEKYNKSDFLDEIKEDPGLLKDFVSKVELEKLEKLLSEKKEKSKKVKKIISLKSEKSSGIRDIKKALETEEGKITYLGSSNFSIITTAIDYKKANAKMHQILEKIKENSKNLGIKLEIKED